MTEKSNYEVAQEALRILTRDYSETKEVLIGRAQSAATLALVDELRASREEVRESGRIGGDSDAREAAGGFLPGDLVKIHVTEYRFSAFNGHEAVITHVNHDGDSKGWFCATSFGSMRCMSWELEMITPREER